MALTERDMSLTVFPTLMKLEQSYGSYFYIHELDCILCPLRQGAGLWFLLKKDKPGAVGFIFNDQTELGYFC